MKLEMELWQLITLLLAFFGCIAGFGKLLLDQVDRRLESRFKAQEEARESGAKSLRDTIERYTAQGERTTQQVQALERDFMDWKAEMPLNYVRREDYIRGQSVLEAKQDALYSETKMIQMQLEGLKVQIKGVRND